MAKQKVFEVFVFWSGKVGWVHSSWQTGKSWEDVIQKNPKYADKWKYIVLEDKKSAQKRG